MQVQQSVACSSSLESILLVTRADDLNFQAACDIECMRNTQRGQSRSFGVQSGSICTSNPVTDAAAAAAVHLSLRVRSAGVKGESLQDASRQPARVMASHALPSSPAGLSFRNVREPCRSEEPSQPGHQLRPHCVGDNGCDPKQRACSSVTWPASGADKRIGRREWLRRHERDGQDVSALLSSASFPLLMAAIRCM
jgi:hypothetical protein